MALTPFDTEYKRGRKTIRKRGVRDEQGREFRNVNEASAQAKRDTNPLYGAKITSQSFMVIRLSIGGSEYWVMIDQVSNTMCRALPFDKSQDMQDRMAREGVELPDAALTTLHALLVSLT